MAFSTQAEIYQALLDGKTICKKGTYPKVFLENGMQNRDQNWSFASPEDWEINEEPVLYYRWKRTDGMNVQIIPWTRHTYKNKDWIRIEPGKTFEEI